MLKQYDDTSLPAVIMPIRGRLTEDDMDRLEWWIGKGPKQFTLLYAITIDGCTLESFHQKCDNQGPTVTVLYNQHGSVYGGYASDSWRSSGGYLRTTDSFLFQLHYNGYSKANKFMLKQNKCEKSFYCDSGYGPDFGYSPDDLKTFTETINVVNGCFPLKGSLNIGNCYENHGMKAAEINNDTMSVTELEVYKVHDGQRQKQVIETWRNTDVWNEKLQSELTEEIKSFRPIDGLKVTEARILMLGPIGGGKSSFYNTISSVFRGRITRRACSGSTGQSLTTAYTPYTVKVRSGSSPNFRLCDTRGLEESTGLTDVECNYLLDGNIPDYYQNSSTPISPKIPGFKPNPTANDQIHCVVFVLDSTTLEVISPKLVEKIKRFQLLMNEKGIPQLILLTKIDKLCKDVEKDISFVYKSKTVGQNVDKAAQLLGLPRGHVLPVKNYENETKLDENINILALLALREILNSAEDFLDNLSDRNNDVCKDIETLQVDK